MKYSLTDGCDDLHKKVLLGSKVLLLATIMTLLTLKAVNCASDKAPFASGDKPISISNGGFVVQRGDQIYYKNGLGNYSFFNEIFGSKGKLFKMTADGLDKTRLSNNVVDGNIKIMDDWIYYFSSELGGYSSYLCRVRNDGWGQKRIASPDTVGYEINNGWIYYYDNGCLWRMKLDGSNKIKMVPSRLIIIGHHDGEWVYYTDQDQNDCLFRINNDGSDIQQLSSVGVWDFKVLDEWIYFEEKNQDNDTVNYCKCSKDGSKKSIISQIEFIQEVCKNTSPQKVIFTKPKKYVYCRDQELYYIKSWNNSLFKSNMDGSDEFRLCEDQVHYTGIDVVGEWIYYYNNADSQLYKIRTNGLDKIRLSDK